MECDSEEHAAGTNNPTKGRVLRVANVRKDFTCDRIFWISTDVLQDAQVMLELDNTQRSAEQELKKKW